MKSLYLFLIILLLLSPVVETRKLKKIRKKKEIATLALIAGMSQITMFVVNYIATSIRYYRQAKLSKQVYKSMVDAIEEKDKLMVDMMHDCRQTLNIQDHILTIVNYMILVASKIPEESLDGLDCEEILENGATTKLKKTENKVSESTEDLTEDQHFIKCLRNEFKGNFTEVINILTKTFSFELSESCEHKIFPFLDNYNNAIGEKKKTLADLEQKMDNSRTMIVHIITFFTERTDFSKMADSQKFGSLNKQKIIRDKINFSWSGAYDYLKSLLKVGVPINRSVMALNQPNSFAGPVWSLSFMKLFRVASEVVDLVKQEIGFSSYSNQILANSVYQKSKLNLKAQQMKFVSFLKEIISLRSINDLYEKSIQMGSVEEKLKLTNVHQIKLPEGLSYSIIFRDLIAKKKDLPKSNAEYQNIFGLYYGDIEVAYNRKEVQQLNQNGFEVDLIFPLGSKGKEKLGTGDEEGKFYVLGRRYATSKEVVFFVEVVPLGDLDVNTDEIGSNYQDYLKTKFHPIMRSKLLNFFKTNCGGEFSVGEIYNLVDISEIKVRLTYDHYVVYLILQKDFLNKEKNKKYVNCTNKYKKLEEGDEDLKICGRNGSLVYQFCEKGGTGSIKASEVRQLIEPHMVYHLLDSKSPDISKITNSLIELGEKGNIIRIGDFDLISHRKDSVSEVEFKRDIQKDVNSKLCDIPFEKSIVSSLYSDVWSDSNGVIGGLKKLNIEIKNNEISHGTLNKKVNSSITIRTSDSRKRKQLLVKNSTLNKYIPLEDYVELVLGKKIDTHTPGTRNATLKDNESFKEPFTETFTGFYANNSKCKRYKDLILDPYVTAYLSKPDWEKNGTLLSALVEGRVSYSQKEVKSKTYFSLSEHLNFNLKKKEKSQDYDILYLGDSNNTQNSSNKLKKTNFEEIVKSLKECDYASLAVNVKFDNQSIENPKIAIYSHENDIEIDLVEGTDKDLKFTKEIALTFSLIDPEQEKKSNSNFTKFEIMNNYTRRAMRRGYLKAETFGGESSFKLYHSDFKKYIMVNVWSKLDISHYEDKYNSICKKN